MTVHETMVDGVALITLDQPPVNGLGHATRVALAAALERADNDPTVQAVVLTGAGSGFSGGADIREFGTELTYREPHLLSLIEQCEAMRKPLVAAVHGVVMGGGLELALACHHRIAAPSTRVAMPEVKLGLIPGAGGTQRLPRAIGVEPALNLIISGETVAAAPLAALPEQQLWQAIAETEETLVPQAMQLARDASTRHAQGEALPLLRSLPCAHVNGAAYFQFVRNMLKPKTRHAPALLAAVDALEAATTKPLSEGLVFEREQFLRLMDSTESRSMRHLFMAERAAGKLTDVPADTPLRPVQRVAVIGAGTMGTGIAMNFLNAGMPVQLMDRDTAAVERGVAQVSSVLEAQVKKGRLRPDQMAQRLALLSTTLRYEEVADADLVIEAVFEDMAIKRAVFQSLDHVMKPGAILASNTSTLDLNQLAAETRRPQDVVGLHFFSPAHVMKLLEVVRGDRVAPDVLATVMALAKTIRKTAVVSGVCDGFIGNRMIEQYVRQAGFLLDEGCSPAQVDRAVEAFGMAMGPFRMSDLAGNDIGWAIRQRRRTQYPNLRFSQSADRLCEMGRLGQKTQAGWYDYLPGQRAAVPSPVVEQMLRQYRQEQGLPTRPVTDEEIVERLLFALVNEACHILEEGIASKASDIDMVYVLGYGFPAWRGGPMHHADQVGLFHVAAAMRRFARNPLDDADFWQPAPLLQRLVADGKTFN